MICPFCLTEIKHGAVVTTIIDASGPAIFHQACFGADDREVPDE
jgi:hypothetical protein